MSYSGLSGVPAGMVNSNLIRFLASLSPGTNVQLQYDSQPPAWGVFQGFENGNVILTGFGDFPGLVRVSPHAINAVSVSGNQRNK